MSNDMVPCLAPALSGIAKKQQTLDEIIARPGLIQVERFQTFRDAGDPNTASTRAPDRTQIIAWVMDSRCRIRVFFDVDATDRIELATGERVTSYLRGLVYLQKYKFAILPPNPSPSTKDYHASRHRHHPELVLHAYDWQKYIGSRDDPLYHEEATYLLSNFSRYPVDGEEGRVPAGYGSSTDEVIWRKQEKEALKFLRNQWGPTRTDHKAPSGPLEAPMSAVETPDREVLMSMLRTDMGQGPLRVIQDIRVFGINPLQELDLSEIQNVLLQNGVKVIPEEPPHDSARKQEPAKPVPRRKACRKSTGRRLPRQSNSPITKATGSPPATQPTTQIIPADSVADAGDVHSTHPPLAGNTSRRSEQAPPRPARKKRVVQLFSSTSPEPRNVIPPADAPQNPRAPQTSHARSSPPHTDSSQSSPPLNRLVTQLPVSSIDTEASQSPSGQPVSTQAVRSDLEMDVDPSPETARRERGTGVRDGESVGGSCAVRQLWELDDDEDGLCEADIELVLGER